MSYSISYEKKHDYLYVHMSGPESLKSAEKFWEDLAEKSAAENHEKFLIIDEVDGRLSTTELHALSLKVAQLFRGKKIAYIDPKTETFDDNRFGENVVYNRGVNAKVFRSAEEGVNWLIKV